jgi:hypothetical protein
MPFKNAVQSFIQDSALQKRGQALRFKSDLIILLCMPRSRPSPTEPALNYEAWKKERRNPTEKSNKSLEQGLNLSGS